MAWLFCEFIHVFTEGTVNWLYSAFYPFMLFEQMSIYAVFYKYYKRLIANFLMTKQYLVYSTQTNKHT